MTTTATATKRTAIYLRVSTTAQDEDGTSLETQEAACIAYAAEHGYKVAATYREVFSGAEFWERPELTRMRDAMREREFEAVIVYDLDRLSRDQNHVGALLTFADRDQVSFKMASGEQLEDSAVGRMILAAKSFAAAIEREKIRERTVRGKRARVMHGKVQSHGIELYGYQRLKEQGTREVIEVEAVVIRKVFGLIADGTPMREIVRRLRADGTPSPSGNAGWARSQLHRIARNPAYMGEAVAWRLKREKVNGHPKTIIRPEAEWIQLPGTTPAIVSPAVWDQAQRRLDAGSGANTKNGARPYLLRGLVTCGVCGNAMYAMPEKGDRVYRCSSREKASGACGGSRVPALALEAFVWGETAAWLEDPAKIVAELERRAAGASAEDAATARQRSALVTHAAKIERQQKTVTARIGEAEDADLARQLGERWKALQAEAKVLAAEIAALDERASAVRETASFGVAVREYAERVRTGLDAFAFEDKRGALEALQTHVIANGNSAADWTIQGVIPASIEGVTSLSSARCAHPPRRPPEHA